MFRFVSQTHHVSNLPPDLHSVPKELSDGSCHLGPPSPSRTFSHNPLLPLPRRGRHRWCKGCFLSAPQVADPTIRLSRHDREPSKLYCPLSTPDETNGRQGSQGYGLESCQNGSYLSFCHTANVLRRPRSTVVVRQTTTKLFAWVSGGRGFEHHRGLLFAPLAMHAGSLDRFWMHRNDVLFEEEGQMAARGSKCHTQKRICHRIRLRVANSGGEMLPLPSSGQSHSPPTSIP